MGKWDKYKVNNQDNSKISTNKWDKYKVTSSNNKANTTEVQNKSFMPGYEREEKVISSRNQELQSTQRSLAKDIAGEYTRMFQGKPTIPPYANPLLIGKTVEAINPRIEAMGANVALKMQEGTINPFALGAEAIKGITGERLGQYGDAYRRLNVPEPIAASLGMGNLGLQYKLQGNLLNWMKRNPVFKFGKEVPLQVAEKADVGLKKVSESVYNQYEQKLKDITGKSNNFDDITSKIDEIENAYPENTPKLLKKIRERLFETTEMSAEELRNLKMELKKGVESVLKGKADANPLQQAQLEIYNMVDDKIVELGGDKYIKMKSEYTKFKNMSNDVKSTIMERGRPGDITLRNWGGLGLTRRQAKSLEQLNKQLPKEEQFLKTYNAWRRGQLMKVAAPSAYIYHRWMSNQLFRNK